MAVEFVTKLLAGLVSAVVGTALLGWFHAGHDAIVAALLVGAFRFFCFADAAWLSLLRDGKRIIPLAVVPTLQSALQLGLIAGMVLVFGDHLFLIGLSYASSQFLFLGLKLAQIRKTASLAGVHILPLRSLKIEKPDWTSGYWKMMGTGYLTSCLSSLMKEGDTLVVGLVASDSSVGFYRLARSLVSVIQLATQALATLVLQDFAEIRRKGSSALVALVHKIAIPFAAVVMAICAVVAVALPYIIQVVYGRNFLGAVLPFRILLVGTAVSTGLFWITPALIAMRELKAMLYISVLNFAAYVVAMLVGLHFLRGLGPAVATSTSWVFGYGASLIWLLIVLKRQGSQVTA